MYYLKAWQNHFTFTLEKINFSLETKDPVMENIALKSYRDLLSSNWQTTVDLKCHASGNSYFNE